MKEYFGKHITLDCFDSDPEAILDTELIARFLTECVSRVNMKVIREADSFYYENEEDPLESGVTATIILSTSLASIHTFKRYSYFSFDLFSCRDFDADALLEYVREVFSPGSVEVNVNLRGRGYFRS